MDLIKLEKKAILVPTPGQTEQEYLASYLSSKKLFYCIPQAAFHLQDALKAAAAFPYNTMPIQQDNYKKVVEDFVAGLL